MKAIAGLHPPIDVDGPRVRLGLLWAVVAFCATVAGPVTAALVFAAVALGAAGQTCRAWSTARRRHPDQVPARGAPYPPAAIGGAVLMTLAAASGPLAVTAAAVVTGVATIVATQARFGGRDWDPALTAAIALLAGVAAASVPLARGELGTAPALVLLCTVLAAEASAYVMGAGARRWFEAPAAATVAIGAMSIAVAAVLVPPFRGASPWVLGAVAGVLFHAGPRLASAVLPRAGAFAPALRRLDGFVAVGPVWILVASVMLDLR